MLLARSYRLKIVLMTAAWIFGLSACSPGSDPRPNLILVTVDTLRWDYLSSYGFEDPQHTPAASRLASNGWVFENAVATAGTTIPSHASMLTGHYARQHGARSNFHHKYPNVPTVTSALRDSGYQTAAFVANLFLFNVGGLAEGFTHTNYPTENVEGEEHPYRGDRPVRQAAKWLQDKHSGQPLFMWLHLWEPHGPYDLTEWSEARLGDYDGLLKKGASLDSLRKRARDIMNSPVDLKAMRDLYAGEVWQADRYLNEFLDHLEEAGVLDNSVVIFTSDHGQSLGERGRMGHGPVHRETVLRVPLILADFRTQRSERVKTRVGTIDIAPTLASLAGLNEPFDMAGQVLAKPGQLDPEWPYFGEVEIRMPSDSNWNKTRNNRFYDANALAVYSANLKMVYRHDSYSLFRTGTQRKAAKPLPEEDEPIMADYLKGLIEGFRATPVDLDNDDLPLAELEALQGLGYTQ